MPKLPQIFKRRLQLPRKLDILILIIATALIWGGMALLTDPEFRTLYIEFSVESPVLLALNTLPIIILLLGLYCATGRSILSGLITGGLFFTLGTINNIKALERQEPFVPTDIRLIREAMAIIGQYGAGNIIAMVGLVVIVVLLGVLAVRFFSAAKLAPAIRIAGPLACIALMLTLIFTVYADEERYHGFDGALANRMTDYSMRGFVYSFLHDITALSVSTPAGFSAAPFTALEAHVPPVDDSVPRPNVVMIMSEAFSTLTDSPHFDFTDRRNPLEHFLQIAEDSVVSGDLIVDVYGGGTIFTEFAALTGISPVTLSNAVVPYEFVRNNTDSIAWLMRRMGYSAIAVHPFHGWFYNRNNVFERLGFEAFLYGHGEHAFADAEMRGGFVSEAATFDMLIDIIDEQRPDSDPLFLFSTTIQNHGGYHNKYATDPPQFFNTDLDFGEEEMHLLNNFIYGLFDVDEQLARLVTRLEDDPEPYVLVYFSDHEPSLHSSIFMELGWGNIWGPPIEVIEGYTIPFFIWQNRAARDEMDLEARAAELGLADDVELSAWHLGPMVMQLLGFDEWSPFMRHVAELRAYLPVMRPGVYRTAGGEFVTTLPPELREAFEFYHKWSYYKVFVQTADER
ncbi:MAG: LTA synthase family protein [Oscillospiraceae bacterium]|nr:LTA synthase family protein [Oscillospiraceae bacterium]